MYAEGVAAYKRDAKSIYTVREKLCYDRGITFNQLRIRIRELQYIVTENYSRQYNNHNQRFQSKTVYGDL